MSCQLACPLAACVLQPLFAWRLGTSLNTDSLLSVNFGEEWNAYPESIRVDGRPHRPGGRRGPVGGRNDRGDASARAGRRDELRDVFLVGPDGPPDVRRARGDGATGAPAVSD